MILSLDVTMFCNLQFKIVLHIWKQHNSKIMKVRVLMSAERIKYFLYKHRCFIYRTDLPSTASLFWTIFLFSCSLIQDKYVKVHGLQFHPIEL